MGFVAIFETFMGWMSALRTVPGARFLRRSLLGP